MSVRSDRIAAIAAQQGVEPEDVSRAAGEIAVHFVDMTPDEALDAIEGADFHPMPAWVEA